MFGAGRAIRRAQQETIENQQRAIDAHTESISNLLASIGMQGEMIAILRTRVDRLSGMDERKSRGVF